MIPDPDAYGPFQGEAKVTLEVSYTFDMDELAVENTGSREDLRQLVAHRAAVKASEEIRGDPDDYVDVKLDPPIL